MTDIEKQLEYYEAKVAIRDDLLEILEKAFSLIPVGQLQQGFVWMPSEEAVTILRIAKDRLREHNELRSVSDDE